MRSDWTLADPAEEFYRKAVDEPSRASLGPRIRDREVLDEERANELISALRIVQLWRTRDRNLLSEVGSKVDFLLGICADTFEMLNRLRESYRPSNVVPLESLIGPYKLIRPILVVLDSIEGHTTATYYECEIFGEGETEFEALQDLRESIVQYYVQLRESSDSLGPLPQRHLQLLSDLILETNK